VNGDQESFFNTWEMILSRRPGVIRVAYNRLYIKEQKAVLDHLRRMTSASGWQPGQRESAQVALKVISELVE
jgi:hypothetical protein